MYSYSLLGYFYYMSDVTALFLPFLPVIVFFPGDININKRIAIATSKNPPVINTICISSFRYTHVITSRNFQLRYAWRLMKAIAEMKCDTEQTMKLE